MDSRQAAYRNAAGQWVCLSLGFSAKLQKAVAHRTVNLKLGLICLERTGVCWTGVDYEQGREVPAGEGAGEE